MICSIILSAAIGTSSPLLDAICQVESNCDSTAVGDNGNAIGGKYKDCYDKEYSEKIINAYWKRYANEKRLGRKVTNEDRARIHNGGPNGYKKKATVGYWSDVKGKMK